MTASPLLPPGMAGRTAETEATDAELSRMTELALPGLRGATADGGTCLSRSIGSGYGVLK